ncbi:ANTAR domain-containing response regulator [Streptomyces sp. HMX87]|uniref:ANTAR domain-containing response regulator n=1 Tax=Streptomyces sp. HMX87 TaxID=3390849 RepID=UPI003A891F98
MTSAAPPRPAGRPAGLVIEGRVEADRAVLLPRGELVRGCADVLAEALADLPTGLRRIDADMRHVDFMDAAGLQFLDLLGGYGHRHGVPVTARHWRGQPRRTLELAGLDGTDPLRVTDGQPAPEGSQDLRVLREEVEQLRQAIDSRPVIDQARGVLMAVHACTPEEAWHILRETSQLSNTKLRTVAAAVTASTVGDGPAPPEEVRTALRAALARHTGG